MKQQWTSLTLAVFLALAGILVTVGLLSAEKLGPPQVISVRQLTDRVSNAQENQAVAVDSVRGYAYVLDQSAVTVFEGTEQVGEPVQLGNTQGVLVNSEQGYAYVTQKGTGIVVVLSATTELERISLGAAAGPMAVMTPTGHIYVTLPAMDKVAIVSRTKRLTEIPVGDGPIDVATDPRVERAYVINENDLTLSIIEKTSVITSVALPYTPTAVVVNPTLGYVYVAHGYNDRMSIIDNGAILTTLTVPEPIDMAIDSSNGRVYVLTNNSLEQQGWLQALSGATVVASTTLEYPLWAVTVNPASGYVYVAHGAGDTGAVTILSRTQPIESFPMGQTPWDVRLNTATDLAYVPVFNGKVVMFGRTPTYETPPLGPESSYTLNCTGTHDLPVLIEIPVGSVPITDVTVVCRPLPTAQTEPRYIWAGQAFRIAAYRDGFHLPDLTFARPLTLTVSYGEAWLGEAEEEELQLLAQVGDIADQNWNDDTIELLGRDPGANKVRATIVNQAPYALSAKGNIIYLPIMLRNAN